MTSKSIALSIIDELDEIAGRCHEAWIEDDAKKDAWETSLALWRRAKFVYQQAMNPADILDELRGYLVQAKACEK